MKNKIKPIIVCTILSISIVMGLIITSGELRDKRNSFLRAFPSHPIIEGKSIDLKYNSYYIAGGTKHHIYLANYTNPLQIIILNSNLTDSQYVKLKIDGIRNQKVWSVRVTVDSPNFYMHDGAVPIIYKGNVNNWTAHRIQHDNEYFLDFNPIGSNSFFIKSLGRVTGQSILGKITNDSPYYIFKEGLLQKQVDGVFCTDGMMIYNPYLSQLIYLYRYRNEFIVMDTNLNLSYRGNTIDTTSKAKIKVAKVTSTQATKIAAPPLMVNNLCAASSSSLFVNSQLLARNEHKNAFDYGSVIDVYSLLNSKYQLSFYIPNYLKKEKLSNFIICGNKLLALFDSHIQVFDLQQRFFLNP